MAEALARDPIGGRAHAITLETTAHEELILKKDARMMRQARITLKALDLLRKRGMVG